MEIGSVTTLIPILQSTDDWIPTFDGELEEAADRFAKALDKSRNCGVAEDEEEEPDCNRASIAAVTYCSPEPAESFPGGTLWGITHLEVLSAPNIWDTETANMREEKPEEARADESEEETRDGRENERRMESEA
ncbi:hypothetical protein NDU88_005015 [Pleurodeles waltl]|uniref:Uncharacterized protein n=1 Tax=Pleurodeles waltl TaxID=8319 RepID=A0AAV7NVE1_PLEWA|nr:hypothetical protein NDU88_005015 [Pleurodeles waltl]